MVSNKQWENGMNLYVFQQKRDQGFWFQVFAESEDAAWEKLQPEVEKKNMPKEHRTKDPRSGEWKNKVQILTLEEIKEQYVLRHIVPPDHVIKMVMKGSITTIT